MARFTLPVRSLRSKPPPSNNTAATDVPWQFEADGGEVKEKLLQELEQMYWDGAKMELEAILLTLQHWQDPSFSHVELEAETDNFIHGFDTFIDQVSKGPREFANSLARDHTRWRSDGGLNAEQRSYEESIRNLTQNMVIDHTLTSIKGDIRATAEEGYMTTNRVERRAKLLLQSASLLDIEKIIEHRPPQGNLPFKHSTIPQLILKGTVSGGRSTNDTPKFAPLECLSCGDVIYGSFFRKIGMEPVTPSNTRKRLDCICESCYRADHYGDSGYVKIHRHCPLTGLIDSDPSNKFKPYDGFIHSVAESKYREMGRGHESKYLETGKGLESKYRKIGRGLGNVIRRHSLHGSLGAAEVKDRKTLVAPRTEHARLTIGQNHGLEHPTARLLNPRAGTEVEEALPTSLRHKAEENPFGNVHMALRIGPLIIENGAANSKEGALVTIREPTNFQVTTETHESRSLTLTGGAIRSLWSKARMPAKQRRIKVVMKQVVGAPFSGVSNRELELEIIRGLVSASQQSEKGGNLEAALANLLSKLQDLINPRLRVYLESIVHKLLNPNTNLTWNPKTNHCQNFCNSLIDTELFGPLVPVTADMNPLYLMSFVCRPAEPATGKIRNKFDVPRGLTEEYLQKFRFGRIDDADIIDTLQEYWYDWGTFGGPIYPFQDIFPWDCTEAFNQYPAKCGKDCNLAKHVWAFPFDSWSIISHHLSRDRFMYAPSPNLELELNERPPPQVLTDEEWMRNRLTVLSAHDALIRAAAAMNQHKAFQETTAWIHEQHENPQLDQLKLGGIHRAQPYGQRGSYQEYFIAKWAINLSRKKKIQMYERRRDRQMERTDVDIEEREGLSGKANTSMGSGFLVFGALAGVGPHVGVEMMEMGTGTETGVVVMVVMAVVGMGEADVVVVEVVGEMSRSIILATQNKNEHYESEGRGRTPKPCELGGKAPAHLNDSEPRCDHKYNNTGGGGTQLLNNLPWSRIFT
ncbi:hypothetical protein FQN51_001788 [Onygenales sp. PD_10]|nr:hypothetical protein FQN51_001788 [Onygenales sp. PD_10]